MNLPTEKTYIITIKRNNSQSLKYAPKFYPQWKIVLDTKYTMKHNNNETMASYVFIGPEVDNKCCQLLFVYQRVHSAVTGQ